jgi:UDP-glucose:(galactosyl)LPS alpha-1,2-glucosyltransferase
MTEKAADLHVGFSIDSKFLPPLSVTVTSILENNRDLQFHFTVLLDSPRNGELDALTSYVNKLGSSVDFIELKVIEKSRLADLEPYKPALYGRLFLPEILRTRTEHFLFMDADLICRSSLTPLLSLQDSSCLLYAVPDEDQDLRIKAIGLSGKFPYFNDGVMWINTRVWCEMNVTKNTLDEMRSDRSLFYSEQDALNRLLEGKVQYLDKKWNVMRGPSDKAIIRHYAFAKPWLPWSETFLDETYVHYMEQGPWPNWKSFIRGRGNLRRYGLVLFQERRYLLWFFIFCKYLLTPRSTG